MKAYKNKGLSPWGTGLSLLGLLITAAIVIYLMQVWSTSLPTGPGGSSGPPRELIEHVEEMTESLNDRSRDMEQAAEGEAEQEPTPAAVEPQPSPQPESEPTTQPEPETFPSEPPAPDETPAAVAPTTPAQQPNVRKAKEPAAGALDALNDRNKELEDMLDE